MARINIEDELFTDRRWIRLVLKVGDDRKALGLITSAWILAQKHWLKDRCVPEKCWEKDLDVLIEVELASKRQDGTVYVKGSKKAFAWLERNSKAGSSKSEKKLESAKNARIKKLNQGSEERRVNSEPGLNLSEPTLNLSEAPTPTLSLPPTLSPFSHSFSNSDSESKILSESTKASASKKESTELNRKIWEAYASSFSERYRVQPTRNASVNAKISQLGKRLGEDAVNVVKFFLKHNDGFYLKKIHDIGLCLKDAESLHVQMQRGQTVTSQDVKNFERTSNVVNLVNEARKGGF